MGGYLRERVLRALGLDSVWEQFNLLSLRLRRVEEDLRAMRGPVSPELLERLRGQLSEHQRPQTLRAAPPPPPDKPQGSA